jgi:hypothetical protein
MKKKVLGRSKLQELRELVGITASRERVTWACSRCGMAQFMESKTVRGVAGAAAVAVAVIDGCDRSSGATSLSIN